MTKRDLIDEVNKRFPHLSRRDSEVIINAIFDSMVEALAQGDRIEIRGFGSFVVKHRRARQGRNPKSGVLVSVAAKLTVPPGSVPPKSPALAGFPPLPATT